MHALARILNILFAALFVLACLSMVLLLRHAAASEDGDERVVAWFGLFVFAGGAVLSFLNLFALARPAGRLRAVAIWLDALALFGLPMAFVLSDRDIALPLIGLAMASPFLFAFIALGRIGRDVSRPVEAPPREE
jgi:hypothetical protein